ncbi:glycogen/starch/alpha-glucan phosphorylase [Neobittarella massiliensis]|uniref:Alpha-1,4 glucan phosphorylase n=1 Tax=Neobittarella massiliensis (ex Bilen et al. 2018) TaxID=2041842 RepID=A0A8J6IQU7_9FIRM|nr:glycogen/starch/alpha-glucan phosphorylase [Neobittarella massiliensis]MBC3517312.1 glycogen/starch/alpha-glucan phosphorylase [Neobittarella massiliensis]
MRQPKQSAEVKNIVGKLKRHFGKTLENATKEELYKASAICIRDEIIDKWVAANAQVEKRGLKRVYYMSAEFLMGRAYTNNLVNLGLKERYQKAFSSLGLDLDDIAWQERDAGLGNGGLGRLAACFLESLATLDLPAIGCGIRYEHGLFRQKIVDGEQVEMDDNWLEDGCVWEMERPDEEVEVRFGGHVEEFWDEAGMHAVHKDYSTVIAVPYDMPVVGYESKMPATLRLWSARSKDPFDIKTFNQGQYLQAMQEKELAESICKVLYPDDNHEQGKILRLKQFYFFTSATMQSMVRSHKERYGDLHTLPSHVVVQINDTHPTLAIPELMRILMDQEGYTWSEAYNLVSRIFNYTNHTILSEALECWDENMFRALLPRIYSIVQEINQRYCERLNRYYPGDMDRISDMAVVAYGQIRMANLCVAVASHVNGVSQLHGEILKNRLFADSYKIYPRKYLAITNGITHRRWLAVANPGLTALMTEYIGDGFIKDYTQFEKLMDFVEDEAFLAKYAQVKKENKVRLAQYLQRTQGITINPDSIFDVQAKRLHEYKRQLLKCLHILYLYNALAENPNIITTPITFIFAAKAAPGYARAKNIIRLINAIGDLVNNDPRSKDKMQVVFIENYGVSIAELLIPATDISEQLSTAGLEASGTGNMKFMMNGAITLGTMDGANIEIFDEVGKDNIYIFGANIQQISQMQAHKSYRPGELFEKNLHVRDAINRLIDGTLPGVSAHQFSDLYQSLLFGDFDGADKYFVLYDLPSYIHRFAKAYALYCDNSQDWYKKAAINTAKSGFFSSDRTISEYNRSVWKLEKLK